LSLHNPGAVLADVFVGQLDELAALEGLARERARVLAVGVAQHPAPRLVPGDVAEG